MMRVAGEIANGSHNVWRSCASDERESMRQEFGRAGAVGPVRASRPSARGGAVGLALRCHHATGSVRGTGCCAVSRSLFAAFLSRTCCPSRPRCRLPAPPCSAWASHVPSRRARRSPPCIGFHARPRL